MERPIEPVTLTLFRRADGRIIEEPREFLLSMGALRRLKTRFKIDNLGKLLEKDAEACGVPVLYEALLDRGNITEEQFADMLPAHLDVIVKAVAQLLGASFPEPKENPLQPTPQIQ